MTEAEQGDCVESVIRRSDKALYISKETGRNKVTSLTNEQLLSGAAEQQDDQSENQASFTCKEQFFACLASDLAIYKIAGIVDDGEGKILSVEPNKVSIRLGQLGIWPFRGWGKTPETQPVEICIEIGDERTAKSKGQRASKQVIISLSIKPMGQCRKSELFQQRARHVINFVRSYFVVND